MKHEKLATDRVVQALRSGHQTIAQIAAAVGCSVAPVQRILSELDAAQLIRTGKQRSGKSWVRTHWMRDVA